jgi:hypothetical protein
MATVRPPEKTFQKKFDAIKANRPHLEFLLRRTMRQIATDPQLAGSIPLPFAPVRPGSRSYEVAPHFTIIYHVSADGKHVTFLDIWY